MTKLEEFIRQQYPTQINAMPESWRDGFVQEAVEAERLKLSAFVKLVRERSEANEGNRGRVTEALATGEAFNDLVEEFGLEESESYSKQ